MSLSTADKIEQSCPASIPGILADFFLKKIEMGSYSSDSDYKHKGKKKKSKHKKGKHKKSKHRHSSKSSSSSRDPGFHKKNEVDDISSSEEKSIKRLKKIKNMKLKPASIAVLPCIPSKPVVDEAKAHSEPCSSSAAENLVFYGPSLELLLSGVDTHSPNSKLDPASNVIIPEHKDNVNSNNDISQTENFIGNNQSYEDSKVKEENIPVSNHLSVDSKSQFDVELTHDNVIHGNPACNVSDSVNDSEIVINTDANKTENKTMNGQKNTSVTTAFSNESEKNPVVELLNGSKNDIDLSSHNGVKDNLKESISGTPISEEKTKCETNLSGEKEGEESEQKIEKKKNYRSRSRSRSKLKSAKDESSKSKHKRKVSRSRSSSRDSFSRKKQKYSLEKSKSQSHKKRSHSRSPSKSRKSRSRSPRRRSRDLSHTTHRRHSRSKSRQRSHSRNKDRSLSRHRDRSSSRSRQKDRSSSRSKHKDHSPSRSRQKDRSSSRSRKKDRSSSVTKNKDQSSSVSKEKDCSSSRSRKKDRSSSRSMKKDRSPSRSRQKDRSSSHSRHKDRSSSRSRHKDRSSSRSRHKDRSSSRSRHKERSLSRSRHEDRSSSRSRHKDLSSSKSGQRSKSRSRSRSKSKSRKTAKSDKSSHSRSRSKEKNSNKIDQAEILATARRNVLKMMKNGTLPEGLPVENLKKEQLISIQAGGKSVQELTDFCQRLSQKENDPDDNDDDKNDDGADDENGFIHHPFKVKEPAMIKLNIKNAVQLPIKTHAQKIAETARLSSQFPVSSGNQHKQKELEWIPVVPETTKTESKSAEKKTSVNKNNVTTVAVVENTVSSVPPQPQMPVSYPCAPEVPQIATISVSPLMPPPMPPQLLPLPMPPPMPVSLQELSAPTQPEIQTYTMPNNQQMIMPNVSMPAPMPIPSASVFKPSRKIDISAIVTKRFQALTKLQQNPNDPDALATLQGAQEDIQDWVQSQQVPGFFTGSTDAKMLSVAELCGPKYYKFRKDFFTHAPPVTEGKGMSLLKKMGWNPGEGLGKNKEGSLEPLVLDIKMDKKGLVGEGENSKKSVCSFTKELQGKHPVSALMELCSKRRWKPPLYTCIMDQGPSHKKQFCFKVEVNGVEYQPLNPCSNKKVAKADSAVICLQALNVFPKIPS